MRQLIASLDPAAALRAQMGGAVLDLAAVATLASLAGAGALRVGVDEEHAATSQAELLGVRRAASGLELRMTPAPSLVKVALETRPERVLLASQARDGSRAPVPLDFHAWGSALAPVVHTLEEAGIEVSVLVAPRSEALKSAHGADASGVELYTGQLVDLPRSQGEEAWSALDDAARLAIKLQLRVGVGGRLGDRSIQRVLEVCPRAEWVAVGRSWTARCLLLGVERATRDLCAGLG